MTVALDRPARAAGAGSIWPKFALRRMAGLAAIFLALLVVSFLIVQLIPGDPATALAGADAGPQEIALVRHQLGLDQPLWHQFASYTGNVLSGHLGTSFMYRQPVATIVFNRLPFTATIALTGIVVVLLVAIPLGMLIGVLTRGGRRRGLDTTFGMTTGFLDSVPGYIMASFLVVVFARGIGLVHLFPPAYTPRYGVSSFVLPVAAIVLGPICTVARVVRRETAVVLETDYMRTARGWRLPALRRHLRWALPNLLTTTLTLSGLVLTGMIGGAMIIESVFALPGLGSGIIKAILDRDYPVIQGMVLVIGMITALVNLLVDVVLGLIDRRTLGGSHVAV
ncbi:ABC transporter permease [Amycolatopsis australiensis]|uniref:Peptide/nickel transport system permease protein n=1 Tax=Amycolatopsis australiensis TaxID=546364 RepID=A0A1K1S7E5_9PSEU|nr:ABC transporter permease [Amycolatopsis australiensis]SFW80007.1 peptide/nickel transport system permease protein [Amycolatopsis australiensis]